MLQNPESEAARKKDEADKLRAAEKFMKVGTGEAFCKGCGYEYKPAKGDPEYPVAAGTLFGVSLRLCLSLTTREMGAFNPLPFTSRTSMLHMGSIF